MKKLNEIKENKRLIIDRTGDDGGIGVINIGIWTRTVIWSNGGGWDHVSVHPFKKNIMPTWYDMCRLKDMFFDDNEAVIQIHPQKSEYVNNVSNCLHLWRYQGDMPLPPRWMVGTKDGENKSDVFVSALKELEG